MLIFRLLGIFLHAYVTCPNGPPGNLQLLALVQKGRPPGGRLDGHRCGSWKRGDSKQVRQIGFFSIKNVKKGKKKSTLKMSTCKYTMREGYMVFVVDEEQQRSLFTRWVWTFLPWPASENNQGILQLGTLSLRFLWHDDFTSLPVSIYSFYVCLVRISCHSNYLMCNNGPSCKWMFSPCLNVII